MPVDLESRLHTYREALDDAIEVDRRRPSPKPNASFRLLSVGAVAAVVVGLAGVVALTAIDRPDRTVPTADAPSTGSGVSPTAGVLPRLLLDQADGWAPTHIEDYLLADSGGAFTRIRYERTADDGTDQRVDIVLRRTPEPIRIAESQYAGLPCDAIRVFFTDRPGYITSAYEESSSFAWNFDDHVLVKADAEGMPVEEATQLAHGLALGAESDWVALRESLGSSVVGEPSAERATFQQFWRADYGLSFDGSDPPTEVTTWDGESANGEWTWDLLVCADPAATDVTFPE